LSEQKKAIKLLSVCVAALAFTASQIAHAEPVKNTKAATPVPPPGPSNQTAAGDSAGLDEIVVTGAGTKQVALQTSYSVTVLGDQQISKSAAVGLAGIANTVPGLQGEFSQGEANTNINVRGTQGTFISFISIQEDGLPTQYSSFFAELQTKYDLTYGRVETVLGGPSGIFTAQGSAATINFISRKPSTVQGEARVSLTDFGQYRGDLFYGGPIGHDGWYGSAGGFYRGGKSVRDTGYQSGRGGQFRGHIGKDFANGGFEIAYKHIDDHTDYVNPLPVNVAGRYPTTAVPGFDALRQTLQGPDTQYIVEKTGAGLQTLDLGNGVTERDNQLTISGHYNVGSNLSFEGKVRVAGFTNIDNDYRGGPNSTLYNADTYIASKLLALQAAFPTATHAGLMQVGTGQLIASPATLNTNGLLATGNAIQYTRKTNDVIGDLRINYNTAALRVTAGLQYWDVKTKSHDDENTILTDVRDNANRFDVVALDANNNVVGHLAKAGVLTYGALDNYGGLDTISLNPYLNVELNITKNLHVDAGIHYEHASIDGFGEDVSFGTPLSSSVLDPTSLSDRNGHAVTANGAIYRGHVTANVLSTTVGANYKLANDLAVYARWASAGDMGYQNEFAYFNIPAFGTPAGSNLGLTGKAVRLKFVEAGIRYSGHMLSGYLTGFKTTHKNTGIIYVDSAGVNHIEPADTKAYGVEFGGVLRPVNHFDIAFSGVVMHSRRQSLVTGVTAPLDRLPAVQLKATPTLHFGKLQIFGGAQYYSHRYQDAASTRLLPAYTSFDAGAIYDLSDAFRIMLQGTNVTNTLGFTSGNFREPQVMENTTYGYASVIQPRVVTLSLQAKF
jgi:hypothetical protein